MQILISLRVFRIKCQYVWPLTYHLGLCVEKYPNKKSKCCHTLLEYSLLWGSNKAWAMVTLVSFQGLINSKTSIPITFTWVSSPAGHNLSVCLALNFFSYQHPSNQEAGFCIFFSVLEILPPTEALLLAVMH